MTSNPSIFEKAILGSTDYDDELAAMAKEGLAAKEIYDPSRSRTCSSPPTSCARCGRPSTTPTASSRSRSRRELARDTEGTLALGARRYWERVDRPNLIIKIPGTDEGVPAIEQAIYEGINVNVTLLFAVEAYEKVAEAYIRGLERRLEEGKPLDVHSVASFFVSRVDTEVDKRLRRTAARAARHARPSPTRARPTSASRRSSPASAGTGSRRPAPSCSARSGPRPA